MTRPALLFPGLLFLALVAACAPASREAGSPAATAQGATQVAAQARVPVEPLTFEAVPGQTEILRFDPPGAGGGAELLLSALVRNPNGFGVRLERVAYEVFLAGKAVGQGEVAPQAFVASGSQVPLRLPITADLGGDAELLRGVAGAFTGTPLSFRVEGVAVFTSPSHEFGTNRLTLFEGVVRARQQVMPPRLRLDEQGSSVFLLRENTPVVRLVITAANPGDIGYFLSGRDVALRLGGEVLAVQDVAPVPVPAGQESRFELIFYPTWDALTDPQRALLAAALSGIPTSLDVSGAFAVDVLGVASYPLPEGARLQGFIRGARP